MKLIYLACPYSHSKKSVMLKRFKLVTKIAALMTKQGQCVFSPITHGHELNLIEKLPSTWEFWSKIDMCFLSKCDELRVVTASGWKESVGVTAEIQHALENSIPITMINPATLGVQDVL